MEQARLDINLVTDAEREKLQEAVSRENGLVNRLKKKVLELEAENEQLQGENAKLEGCLQEYIDSTGIVQQELATSQIESKKAIEHYKALSYAIEEDSNLKFDEYQQSTD